MKALVFHKPKDVSVDTVEDPRIKEPSDAIIKFTTTAICGSETAASIGSAVQRVCEKLKHTLLKFSRHLENSPFTRGGSLAHHLS